MDRMDGMDWMDFRSGTGRWCHMRLSIGSMESIKSTRCAAARAGFYFMDGLDRMDGVDQNHEP